MYRKVFTCVVISAIDETEFPIYKATDTWKDLL